MVSESEEFADAAGRSADTAAEREIATAVLEVVVG